MRRFRTFGETKKRGGIPADCYEVEYLQGDGNSYINLGTPIPSGYWHKAKFKFTNTDTSYRAIIGARQASMVKDYQTTLSSGNLLIRYGTPTDQFWQRIAINDVHTLELTSNMEVILDGVNLKTIGYSEPNPSINIYVMALNQNGSAIQIFGSGDYLYSIEVGSGSSKLYDLVPVRRVENGVSVGYLCDRLTGTLYGNAGTGAFVIGPDKYDAEVEYIQSHGGNGEWINTGITYSSYPNISFAGEFRECSSTANSNVLYLYGLFGVCEATNGNASGFRAVPDGILLCGGRKGSTTASVPGIKTARVTFSTSYSSETATINGADYSFKYTPSYTASTVPIGIFCYAADSSGAVVIKGGNYSSAAKCYYFKIYSNDVLVRDFIPVRYRGVGYLYDKVSGRLFGNQGSGEFVIGADVKHAKDYVQDGLVAMWDGIENAGWGVHDGAATVWKELVSGATSAAFDPAFEWTDKGLKTAGGTRTSSSLAPAGLGAYCQSTMDYSIEVSYKDWTNGGTSRTLFGPHNSGYVRVHSYARSGLDQIACNFNNGTYYYFGTGSKSVVEGSHTLTMVKRGQTPYVYLDGVYVPAQSGGIIGTYEPGSSLSYFAWNNAATHDETYCRIAMYSRALTDAEIAANYAVDKVRFGI